jgi:histidine ammonia-lyase
MVFDRDITARTGDPPGQLRDVETDAKMDNPGIVVTLDGSSLTIEDLVGISRGGALVRVDNAARQRVRRSRDTLVRAIDRGDAIYGATTGVGAHKTRSVHAADSPGFEQLLLASQRVGHGPLLEQDAVRAVIARLVNGFAKGVSGVREELVEELVEALNEGRTAAVPMLGSVGQADLVPLGELVGDVVDVTRLGPKEVLALTDNNAFSTGLAALAVHDCRRLIDTLDVAAALDLEAFRANLSILHQSVAAVRPRASVGASLTRFHSLLADSELWRPGAARNLQDPLTFRTVVELHAAMRDALSYAEGQVSIELNASQENPIVVPDEDRLVSVGNFEIAALAAAIDLVRIALAPVLSSACERVAKLLHTGFSGLPTGLSSAPDSPEDALSELAVVAAALASEARLLAQPVSFEIVTTNLAEGIEDRATMAPLGARRLRQMVALGERLAAVELVVAVQAIDLREPALLGEGASHARGLVRRLVPFTGPGQPPPSNLEPLVELVRSGAFASVGHQIDTTAGAT